MFQTKITFEIKFKTYFDSGEVRRRMKSYDAWGYRHYNGVHWYKISVYDAKFGWTTDQHLGREFYGNFGTFDVELTFASNFIVEATGNLLNRDEVLPKDLRDKLDVKNFKDKPFNSPPSTIIEYNKEIIKLGNIMLKMYMILHLLLIQLIELVNHDGKIKYAILLFKNHMQANGKMQLILEQNA